MHHIQRRVAALALLLLAPLLLVACGGGDDGGNAAAATPEEEVELAVSSMIDAFNDADMETFLSYWTNEGLESEFGVTRDVLEANPEGLFGLEPILLGPFVGTEVADDEAGADHCDAHECYSGRSLRSWRAPCR
jgi:hypothetical protein